MTRLIKSITREVDVHGLTRPLIIEMTPTDLLFHEKGCREVHRLPIKTALIMAVRLTASEHKEK